MTDFVDIFSQCESKIAETILFNEDITAIVKTVEPRTDSTREYGDTFQSLLEAFKPNELPAMVVSVDRPASTSDNNISAQDNYHIKCDCGTIVSGKNLQDAMNKTQKIIFYLESLIKSQRSSVLDFSGFGGTTEIMPVTQFEYSEVNNKFIIIATTGFTVMSIQEFALS